jgi:alpha-L-rhamnosidase
VFEYGYADVALQLLESDKLGSFLYMKNKGATTFWETWFGGGSQNHPMFGACSRQLVTSILGIKQESESCGYKRVKIAPKIPKKLSFAKGKISTVNGEISVSWRQDNAALFFEIIVPSNMETTFEYMGKVYVLNSGLNVINIDKS